MSAEVADTEPPPGFYRRLPWSIVVRLDGDYDDADEPNPAVEDPNEPVGKVVIELPDFVADSLAHMIHNVWDVTERLSNGASPEPAPSRDLAGALHDAIESQAGYRCHNQRKAGGAAAAETERSWPPPWFGAGRTGQPDVVAGDEELLADGSGQLHRPDGAGPVQSHPRRPGTSGPCPGP